MFGDTALLVGGEGGVDGGKQGGDRGVAALGQVLVFDDAEGGFNVV